MKTEINFCEQNTDEFENSKAKNAFIQSTKAEWIGFADSSVTGEAELCRILEENSFLMEYDVILFGEDIPEGDCDFWGLMEHPQCVIYAICFRRCLLSQSGPFNRFLTGNCNLEFLLRLALKGRVYSVPCSADKRADFDTTTMAYIVRSHMELLRTHGKLEETFLRIVQVAEQLAKVEQFNNTMNRFLRDSEEYERIASDTAPIFIMVGDDTCYGVVAGFANSLADELVGLGQAVITTNGRYGDYHKLPIEQILNRHYKAIIGFQAPALESANLQRMKGKRFQFWFDNPIFFDDFFRGTSKQTYLLCQDAYYAKFIREHYAIENVVQFPPAGEDIRINQEEKTYDIVFVGSYEPLPDGNYEDAFQRQFYHYMLMNPHNTFESGLRKLEEKSGVSYDEENFMRKIQELQEVCFDVLQSYRHKVVETILSAGIQLHVFGDSWRRYCGRGSENLIIHPQVMGDEALDVWARSKIGLNIMRGHKAGMTERIANIMLCGACCLSDETVYLKEHFQDGKDIVLYQGNDLEKLPEKIRYLLQHEEERKRIALAGRKKAQCEHTWKKRAEELLEIINCGIM